MDKRMDELIEQRFDVSGLMSSFERGMSCVYEINELVREGAIGSRDTS